MAQHRAATPGGPDILLDSPAELATEILRRLGAIPTQRQGESRHGGARSFPRLTADARPAMAAVSVTAVGAAAAIAATGGFSAVTPSSAALSFPVGAVAAASDLRPAAPALVDPAPVAEDLTTVHVSTIVSDARAAARELTQREPAVPAHVPKPVPPAAAPDVAQTTGVGGAALATAMTAIGKPYSWGAVGPSAFDCSGLVQWAFAKAGVKLPRTAAAQSKVGTPVTRSQLRPGDLVFFYSPVSHVGIYVGGGKVVNATQTGEPVQVSNIAYMPIHNMRRI